MIIPQQEMMAKAIGDTVGKIVDDMKTLAKGGGDATKALIEQQKAQRELNMQISAGVTGLLSQTGGLITKVTELTKLTSGVVADVNRGMGVDTTFAGRQNDGRAVPIPGSRPAAPAASTTTVGPGIMDSEDGSGYETPANTTGATSSISNSMLGAGMQTGPTETSDSGVQNVLTELVKQSKESNSYLRNLANAGM